MIEDYINYDDRNALAYSLTLIKTVMEWKKSKQNKEEISKEEISNEEDCYKLFEE